MSIDVSVVIPTYNTGDKLDGLLGSLAGQSLAAERFEVVVVDDGSTDDTWERLQKHAESMPNLVIERIPNSGWPGRPRNVGTDKARGRFVFYSDHDDEFFPNALEAMLECADRTSADVVIGKEIRGGADLSIGPELFYADRDQADLFDDNVLALITPHKLFRTSFLRDNGIRFPEGKRRLEDHVLLAEVYTRTDRIAVLASTPCYRWIIYEDGSNNSSELGDPAFYFDSLEDVFTAIEASPVSQETKDELVRFWYSTRMLKRLYGRHWETWADDYRAEVVHAIADLAERRIPARLDEGLLPLARRRTALLRARDVAGIAALAEGDFRVHPELTSLDLTWTEAGLQIDLRGHFADRNDEVFLLDRVGDGIFWRNDTAREVDLTPALAQATLDVFVRQHRTSIEWYGLQPAAVTTRDTDEGVRLEVAATYTLDPATLVFGSPMEPGAWSLYFHARALGYSSRHRLRTATRAAAVLDGLPVAFSPNKAGQVVWTVGALPRFFSAALGEATVVGDDVEVDVSRLVVRDPAAARFTIGGSRARLEGSRLIAPATPGEVRVGYDDGQSKVLLEVPHRWSSRMRAKRATRRDH